MPAPASRPRGPRGADADTRADIVRAALALFSAHGYEATSMRAIAKEADVDPSLPRHYFPSKSALFVEALGPIDQVERNVGLGLLASPDHLGETMLGLILDVWDSPESGPRMRILVQSAAGTPEIAGIARSILFERLMLPIAKSVGLEDADARAAAALSQILGLIVARYILQVEPLASASREDLIRRFAPAIQRLITGTS